DALAGPTAGKLGFERGFEPVDVRARLEARIAQRVGQELRGAVLVECELRVGVDFVRNRKQRVGDPVDRADHIVFERVRHGRLLLVAPRWYCQGNGVANRWRTAQNPTINQPGELRWPTTTSCSTYRSMRASQP